MPKRNSATEEPLNKAVIELHKKFSKQLTSLSADEQELNNIPISTEDSDLVKK